MKTRESYGGGNTADVQKKTEDHTMNNNQNKTQNNTQNNTEGKNCR